ncbi:MAG: signal recognition particle-docking protein FtsY [Vulcanimicrobiaceae bacterium]
MRLPLDVPDVAGPDAALHGSKEGSWGRVRRDRWRREEFRSLVIEQEFDSGVGKASSVSWLTRLRASLGKARESFAAVAAIGRSRAPITPEFWDELEEQLILADLGNATTQKILTGLRTVAKQEAWKTTDQVVDRFRRDVERFLTLPGGGLRTEGKPAVILVVGVNGSGKTTTIGKLAVRLRAEGKRVLLVAGDTFRAAAAEQLAIWAQRSGSELVRGVEGADPAAVVFDGIQAAVSRGVDVAIVDTAGRLQTKTNLMEELKKIARSIERLTGSPPTETLLVVDGTTGQNALSQAKLFHAATRLTGIAVTKLDSSAKGGVLIGLVDTLEVPIKLVGLGETPDSLQAFDPSEFVTALFDEVPGTWHAGVRA